MAWMNHLDLATRLPRMLINGQISYSFDGIPLHPGRLKWAQRINLLKCGVREVAHSTWMIGSTPTLQIEPTNICNLGCPLCPTGAHEGARKAGCMSMDTFNLIMKDLGNTLVGVILYCWGEPFINKNMFEMIGQCSQRGISTVTSTNGHYLQTIDEALAVVDAGLQGLVIALDGVTQEVYTVYRKNGDVEKVKNCIHMIQEAKRIRNSSTPYTNVRVVATKDNLHEVPEIEQLARREKVNLFSIKSVGCLTGTPNFSKFEAQNQSISRFEYRDGQRVNRELVRCPYPFRQPTVFWDGTIVGCEFDYDATLAWGKLGEQSFSKIWNSPRAKGLRRQIKTGVGRPCFCARCPYQDRAKDSCVVGGKELNPLVA